MANDTKDALTGAASMFDKPWKLGVAVGGGLLVALMAYGFATGLGKGVVSRKRCKKSK